jgi:uncharacterized protein YdcH (DUF465 family)
MHANSLKHHIKHLEESHSKLDKEVDTLEQNGLYEDLRLESLKKKRLHLKDELVRCRQQLTEML